MVFFYFIMHVWLLRYLQKCSDLIELLVEMHKKNSKFKWTQRQSLAFQDLKKKKTHCKNLWSQKVGYVNYGCEWVSNFITRWPSNKIPSKKSDSNRNKLFKYWKRSIGHYLEHRAQQFLFGKMFLLKSDHKLLEFIFNPRKKLLNVTSRILRCAINGIWFWHWVCKRKYKTICWCTVKATI